MDELKECNHRQSIYTPECGGMVYWYCNRDTKQINVYEDCKNCNGSD